jgi:hypothetical protein
MIGLISCNEYSNTSDDIQDIDSSFRFNKEPRIINEDTTTWNCSEKNYVFCTSFIFYDAEPFSEGFAAVAVRNDGKFGYINTSCKLVIPCMYKSCYPFSDGMAIVVDSLGRYGFIDTTGKQIIACQFTDVRKHGFENGLAQVFTDKTDGHIDKTGKYVIGPYKYHYYFKNGFASLRNDDYLYGCIDMKNHLVVDYKYIDFGDFYEGIAPVQIGSVTKFSEKQGKLEKRNGMTGFVDKNGKVIKDFKYTASLGANWRSDSAVVIIQSLEIEGKYYNEYYFIDKGKWGFIDTTGKVIINFQYDEAWEFSSGRAAVRKGEKWGYIDKNGNLVIGYKYETNHDFNNGYNSDRNAEKDLWAVIDSLGKVVIGYNYDGIWDSYYPTNFIPASKNGKYGFINKKEKVLVDFIFDRVIPYDDDNGRFMVEMNDQWGIIDNKGRMITECIYEYLIEFNNGLADVRKDKKYGLIDKNGKIIVDFDFYWACEYSDGLIPVQKSENSKWAFIKIKSLENISK